VLAACGDARAPARTSAQAPEQQVALFPKGSLFTISELPGSSDDRELPACLHLLAPVLARGVCVPLDVARPDGAHDARRFGVWTCEYARTTQIVGSDGATRTRFTDAPEDRMGLESRGEFRADLRVGEWTFWHPNGKQRASGSFVDGRLSGPWRFWTPDGELDAALTGVYAADERVAPSER